MRKKTSGRSQTGGRVLTKHQQKPMNCKRQVRASTQWFPHRKVTAETETCRADLLLADQKERYENDVKFLKLRREDRARRTQYRHNLKERRWEAYERIAILQEDTLDFWQKNNKRKRLSNQVWQVAQDLENKETKEVTDLSASLPKTPTDWTKQDGEAAPRTPKHDLQPQSSDEPNSKMQKTELSTATDQALTLDQWIVESFLGNQPMDPGLALTRVKRKDPKFRWACYSRLPPRLRIVNQNQWGVSPHYGIQLIESYRNWKAHQVSP